MATIPTHIVLRPRTGPGPNIAFDTMRSELQIPPRIHLDLYATDRDAEVARLKELGATEVHWSRMPEDADFTILADPEGNRFCVIDKSNPRTEWG
jgi:predicted enzyme related to lactoylglutathione lyase